MGMAIRSFARVNLSFLALHPEGLDLQLCGHPESPSTPSESAAKRTRHESRRSSQFAPKVTSAPDSFNDFAGFITENHTDAVARHFMYCKLVRTIHWPKRWL